MVNTPGLINLGSRGIAMTVTTNYALVIFLSNVQENHVLVRVISVSIFLRTRTLLLLSTILIMVENQAFVHEPDIVCQYCMKLVPVSRFKAHIHDEHLGV